MPDLDDKPGTVRVQQLLAEACGLYTVQDCPSGQFKLTLLAESLLHPVDDRLGEPAQMIVRVAQPVPPARAAMPPGAAVAVGAYPCRLDGVTGQTFTECAHEAARA